MVSDIGDSIGEVVSMAVDSVASGDKFKKILKFLGLIFVIIILFAFVYYFL